MYGKFDGVYMNHLANKNYEWAEEKEEYIILKNYRSQSTSNCVKLKKNSGSGK